MWGFNRKKPTIKDVVEAEKNRRKIEKELAERTQAFQQSLSDALMELGPKKEAKKSD